MSRISMEDSSWSFSSKGWDNSRDINPLSAVYAVKKEVQAGIHQHGGMACSVMIEVGKSQKMQFVTSSDVVAYLKTTDNKKPTEMHPFPRKKKEGCHLVVNSTVNNFGPFSFLSMNPQSSPGLKKKDELTFLDFQVPRQNLESDFEGYTFDSSEKLLKLKFVYKKGTGKHILLTKQKDQLELPFVLGAPIIIENTDVTPKHLSSRWPVVGVVGLNEELELSPHFVTADMFAEQGNSASGSEQSDSTDSRPIQCKELNVTAAELVASGERGTLPYFTSASGRTDYSVPIANTEEKTPVSGNRLNTTVPGRQRKAGVPSDNELLSLAAELGSKWKMLSSVLRIPTPSIEAIDEENRRMVEKCYSSLILWKQRNGSQATYEVLEAGLCHATVDRRELAEKYCYVRIIPQEHDGRG